MAREKEKRGKKKKEGEKEREKKSPREKGSFLPRASNSLPIRPTRKRLSSLHFLHRGLEPPRSRALWLCPAEQAPETESPRTYPKLPQIPNSSPQLPSIQ